MKQLVETGEAAHCLEGGKLETGLSTLPVDRSQLMLGRGHLVVLGPGRHPQLPQFHVQILHISAHPLADGAEVMVLQLLALGRGSAEQGAPGEDQILPLKVLFSVQPPAMA